MNDYLEGSLAWSFVWGVVGYVVGLVQVKLISVYKKRKAMQLRPRPDKANDDTVMPGDSVTHRQRGHLFKFYVLFAVIGLGMVGQQLTWQRNDDRDDKMQREAAACLVSTVGDIYTYLDARSSLGEDNADATTAVIQGIARSLRNGGDIVEIQASLQKYIDEQEDIQGTRDSAPLPKFPSGKCGTE